MINCGAQHISLFSPTLKRPSLLAARSPTVTCFSLLAGSFRKGNHTACTSVQRLLNGVQYKVPNLEFIRHEVNGRCWWTCHLGPEGMPLTSVLCSLRCPDKKQVHTNWLISEPNAAAIFIRQHRCRPRSEPFRIGMHYFICAHVTFLPDECF